MGVRYGPWQGPFFTSDTEVSMHAAEHTSGSSGFTSSSTPPLSWDESNPATYSADTDLGWTSTGDQFGTPVTRDGVLPFATLAQTVQTASTQRPEYDWGQATLTVREVRSPDPFNPVLPAGASGVQFEGSDVGAPAAPTYTDLTMTGGLDFQESTGDYFHAPSGWELPLYVVGEVSIAAGLPTTRDAGALWPQAFVSSRTFRANESAPGGPPPLAPPDPFTITVPGIPFTVGVVSSVMTSPYEPVRPDPTDTALPGQLLIRSIYVQIQALRLTATVTWPRYRFTYPTTARPLRVKQRDDGLGSSARRAKGSSSRQRSVRVRGYS